MGRADTHRTVPLTYAQATLSYVTASILLKHNLLTRIPRSSKALVAKYWSVLGCLYGHLGQY